MRRDLFLDLGGFDEGYVNGYEDVDLCFRIGEAGLRCYYEPDSVLYHFEGASRTNENVKNNGPNTCRLREKWQNKVRADKHDLIQADGWSEAVKGSHNTVYVSDVDGSRTVISNEKPFRLDAPVASGDTNGQHHDAFIRNLARDFTPPAVWRAFRSLKRLKTRREQHNTQS